MHAMTTRIVSLDLRSTRLPLAESFPGGRYVVTYRGNHSHPCHNYACHFIPPDLSDRRGSVVGGMDIKNVISFLLIHYIPKAMASSCRKRVCVSPRINPSCLSNCW